MDIFRKTPMAPKKSYLQRRLGLAELIFLGVGSIVGTGTLQKQYTNSDKHLLNEVTLKKIQQKTELISLHKKPQ